MSIPGLNAYLRAETRQRWGSVFVSEEYEPCAVFGCCCVGFAARGRAQLDGSRRGGEERWGGMGSARSRRLLRCAVADANSEDVHDRGAVASAGL